MVRRVWTWSYEKMVEKKIMPSHKEIVEDAIKSIMEQREFISKAFIAETGFNPSEIVQILDSTPTGFRWYLEKRIKE